MIQSLIRGLERAVVIDFETSGINPFVHSPLSLAVVPVNEELKPLTLFIRQSKVNWSEYGREVFKKYEAEWIEQALDPSDACQVLESYLLRSFGGEQALPVGHNVGFDMAFLRKLAFQGGREEIKGLSHRAFDTHSVLLYLAVAGKLPREATTSDGAFNFFQIDVPSSRRHTALGDAQATKVLLQKLFESNYV